MKTLNLSLLISLFLYSSMYAQLNEDVKVDKWKCKSGNCKDGKGTMIAKFKYNNHDCVITLEGEFENGLIKNGTYDYNGGFYGKMFTYTGDFVNGKREGKGVLQEKENNNLGYKYEGEWKDGKKHGKGIETYPNGDYLEGIYENDKFVKLIIRKSASGTTYESVENSDKTKVVYSNGSKYEGYIEGSQRVGEGKMTYSNFDEYEGMWRNDNRNGEGAMFWVNGDIYSGQWKSNNQNGEGTKKWANGNEYTGGWKTNKKHGFGKYYINGKDSIIGYFYNDQFLSTRKEDFEAKLKDENAAIERSEQERIELSKRLYEDQTVKVQTSHCVSFLLAEKSVNIFLGTSVSYYAIFVNVPYEGKSPTQAVSTQYAKEAMGQMPAGLQVVQTFFNENCDCKKVKQKVDAQIDISEFRIEYSKTIK